jgi:recombination protein RecA
MLEQIADRMRALKGVIVAVEKQFGKGAVMTLGDEEEPDPVAVIPTGSLALDLATGIGGYPRGRIVEIYGPESSGKTTLALHAIAEAQKTGGVAAFIDAEHALDVAYARGIGVATEKLLVSQPDTGEQALDITEMLVRSGVVDLVVIDSVAALTPKAELEGDMGDAHMGLQARLMSQALRKLTAAAYRGQTTLMFLNQLRQKIGVTFGSPETTTGGNALKFYASMRFDVRRIGQVKVGDEPVGGRTRVKVAKNKFYATQCLRFIRYKKFVSRGVQLAKVVRSPSRAQEVRKPRGSDGLRSWFVERFPLVAQKDQCLVTPRAHRLAWRRWHMRSSIPKKNAEPSGGQADA